MDWIKLFRKGDPETSKEAAQSAPVGLIERILEELKNGPGTYDELATRTGLRPDQVWRRLSDAHRKGLAIPLEETRPGRSGRLQRVWRLGEVKESDV